MRFIKSFVIESLYYSYFCKINPINRTVNQFIFKRRLYYWLKIGWETYHYVLWVNSEQINNKYLCNILKRDT